MRGEFIVVEGIGGCGKDTQVRLLEDYFRETGVDVLVTREHTRDTPPGILIEKIIKRREERIDALALQLLYVVDRRNHDIGVIRPALDGGSTVVGNRYYPTTVAYCPEEWRKTVLRLNQEIVTRPDLVVIIDTDPVVAAGRVEGRGDADIFDRAESLKRCRAGYRWYAENSGDRVTWVDGNGSREEVFGLIRDELMRRKIT